MSKKTLETDVERMRNNAVALVGMLPEEVQLEVWKGLVEEIDRLILDDIGNQVAKVAKAKSKGA